MQQASVQRDLAEIRQLYSVGKFAADSLASHLQRASKDPRAKADVEAFAQANSISAKATRKYLRQGTHLKGLRAVLFVRLVSALEVFLVDTVRWLFLHRKDLFLRDDRVEFAYNELLAAQSLQHLHGKLIAKECRRLQNKGFLEVRTYYQQRFSIDFGKASSPSMLPLLQEMHDRRNLLVHRLGRTDEKYRRDYKSRAARLGVSETYFLEAIGTAERLAGYLRREAQRLASAAVDRPFDAGKYSLRIDLVEIDKTAEAVLDPDYAITAGTKIVCLREILVSQVGDSGERTLALSGPRVVVQEYVRALRSMERLNALIVQQSTRLSTGKQRSDLTAAQMDQIAALLPPEPWPRGIHRTVATSLGLTNTQVSDAINMLLFRAPTGSKRKAGEDRIPG